MTDERSQIEAGIAALEAQRAVLGDTVVDAAQAALRARLAAASAGPARTLRQVSILFLDLVGSTTLSQRLDPEAISGVLDDALDRGTAIVEAHGGKVLQYAGDNILAAFGADEVREDDAERAVRCGLSLLALGNTLGAEVHGAFRHEGFNVRIGVHTGDVLLGGGVDAEGSIRGIAVNIAARMEQTAPAGALRISHDTYAQVRGMFEVDPQPPLTVKGVDVPVQSYLVQRARPRSFRIGTRGIEGVATRMIGRSAELDTLQVAFQRLFSEPRLVLITVVAGQESARAGCCSSSRCGAKRARSASSCSVAAPRRRPAPEPSACCARSCSGVSRFSMTTVSQSPARSLRTVLCPCSSRTTVRIWPKPTPICWAT